MGSHSHSHAGNTRLPMTTLAWVVLAPLAVVTLVGLALLWPSAVEPPQGQRTLDCPRPVDHAAPMRTCLVRLGRHAALAVAVTHGLAVAEAEATGLGRQTLAGPEHHRA